MTRQRQVLAVVVAGLLVATAGCNVILGDDPVEFTAAAATVDDPTLEATGYEEVRVDEQLVVRNFSAAGQSRQANVTNVLAQYERQVDLGVLGERRAAVAVAFSSPQVSVLGESFNPIEDLTTREILQRLESQYEGVDVGQQVGARNVTSLGEDRVLRKFEGTATLDGQQVDVYVHATAAFAHEGDFVVFVGIYPQALDGEEDRVVDLFGNLTHPSEA